MKKKILSIGAAAMMFAAGFSAVPTSTFATENSEPVFTESVYELPQNADYVADIVSVDSSSIVMFGGDTDAKTLFKYESKDGGKSWTKGDDYLAKVPVDITKASSVDSYAYLSDDGYVGVYVGTYEGNSENSTGNYNYLITPNGEVKTIFTPEMGDDTYWKMHFAGNDVYLEDIRGNMVVADKSTGKIRGKVMENVDFLFADAVSVGDSIVAVTNSDINANDSWAYKVDAFNDKTDQFYVVDLNGLNTYSKEAGLQLIHKNTSDVINKNSCIESVETLADGSVIATVWDGGNNTEKFVKYSLQK